MAGMACVTGLPADVVLMLMALLAVR